MPTELSKLHIYPLVFFVFLGRVATDSTRFSGRGLDVHVYGAFSGMRIAKRNWNSWGNLRQCCFVHHNPTCPDEGSNLDQRDGNMATNRLSCPHLLLAQVLLKLAPPESLGTQKCTTLSTSSLGVWRCVLLLRQNSSVETCCSPYDQDHYRLVCERVLFICVESTFTGFFQMSLIQMDEAEDNLKDTNTYTTTTIEFL
jgi:hypothetical protein